MRLIAGTLVLLLVGCPDRSSTTKSERRSLGSADANRQYSTEAWRSEILQSAEPVLVDFWAPWCGPCMQMKPALASLAQDFRVHQVNVDRNKELARRYDVSGIPLLLIFKDGKELARFEGVTSERILRTRMEKLAASSAERPPQ